MRRGLVIGLIMLICVVIFFSYENKLHDIIYNTKSKISRCYEYAIMHKNIEKAKDLPALKDDSNAWYTLYHIISHSGGGINGLTFTNSKEAWEYSYNKGNRLVDADLMFTTDSVLVLKHEWGDNLEQTQVAMKDSYRWYDRNNSLRYNMENENMMDFNTFMKSPIHYIYHPLSVYDMLQYMKDHQDLYVSADVKRNDIVSAYKYIINAAQKKSCLDVLDRLIVSVYDETAFKQVKKIYPFKHYVMRQYINKPHNYYDILKFCIENSIHVINLSSCYVNDEGAKELMKHGIHVYVAVVDNKELFLNYIDAGFSGVCSNYIHENDISSYR